MITDPFSGDHVFVYRTFRRGFTHNAATLALRDEATFETEGTLG